MKKNKPYYIIAALLLVLTAVSSCKKDAYRTDGGLANAYSNLSTYDYLKSNQYHQFDTVLLLVDKFKLKDSINNAKTFFAFTDFSVHALMTSLGTTSLNQLTDSVSSKLFLQYMFEKPITIDSATLIPTSYSNYLGNAAPCAIKKVQATYYVNLSNTNPAFTYFILAYVKVNGMIDGMAGPVQGDQADITLPCQTEGIHTSTGTILHVLANSVIPTKR
ncbi:hypothetical protein [Mucilaginibacter sp. KACC 22063]|uniref:hypothetical protein n=1 Tax=Mucilaginibacter sp. KACC 22063 TaxID=3025666 RepID=UPI002365710B|nr:hypothetical protein [Mucilaginibacter sp. KACC 22063]WDF55853.1 hypothetical protein PQ461_02100 [Mucilaginibacter sp. KACC 22063]